MAKFTKEEFISGLKEMTILEIKELVDAMKEEFGVDPSAVAVAAAPAAAVVEEGPSSVNLVLASAGYPNKYEKGKIITGLDNVDDDIIVFHAGTTFNENNVVTNGGRVLNICALGNNLEDVRKKVYQAADKINLIQCLF